MKSIGNLLPSEERFLSTLQPWKCASCGEEFLTKEAPENRLCVGCLSKPRIRERAEALASIGVPARYREPFKERQWPGKSAEWAGEPWACGFYGISEAGKTFLATELLWRQVQRLGKVSARWVPSFDIVRASYGEIPGLWDECLRARVLLIDDLAWGGGEERLFVLLSARHGAKLPTLWTSNHGGAYYVTSPGGQALKRRLFDDGLAFDLRERWR